MDEDHDDDDDDDLDDYNDNDDNDDDDDGKKGMSNTVSHWLLDTVSNVHLFLHSTSRLGQLTGQGTRTVSNVQLGTLSNRTTAQLHNFDTLRLFLTCL